MKQYGRIRAAVLAALVLIFASTSGRSEVWTNWEWVDPKPQGNPLFSVTSGAGLIVAVGGYQTVLVSEDAHEWEVVHAASGHTLHDVTWTGERFVAVGNGLVLSSEDGRRWTERYSSHPELRAVHWNGEQLVAVGQYDFCLTSPDGIDWTEHRLPEEIEVSLMVDLTWDGSQYIAVGYENSYSGPMAAFRSENGCDWSLVPLDGVDLMGLTSVAWGGGRFVAVGGLFGGTAKVAVSEDGFTWTSVDTSLPSFLQRSIFADDHFVVVGQEGLFAMSHDGYDWTSYVSDDRKVNYGVTWAGGAYTVVGENGFITSTTDGMSWYPGSEHSIDLGAWDRIADLEHGGEIYVGIGSGRVVRSVGGRDWSEVVGQDVGQYSVRWINDAFWAVGRFGRVDTSPDGLVWENRYSSPDCEFFDVAWNGEVFVAVGMGTVELGDALLASSSDGTSWQFQRFPDQVFVFTSVAWNGDRFVAVGGGLGTGYAYTSVDGEDWDEITMGDLLSMERIASDGRLFAAVGRREGVGGTIATSVDGFAWQLLDAPELIRFHDVVWTGTRFVAVGVDWLYTSNDGSEWTRDAMDFGFKPGCAEGDESSLIISGSRAFILRADHVSTVPRRGGPRAGPPDGGRTSTPITAWATLDRTP